MNKVELFERIKELFSKSKEDETQEIFVDVSGEDSMFRVFDKFEVDSKIEKLDEDGLTELEDGTYTIDNKSVEVKDSKIVSISEINVEGDEGEETPTDEAEETGTKEPELTEFSNEKMFELVANALDVFENIQKQLNTVIEENKTLTEKFEAITVENKTVTENFESIKTELEEFKKEAQTVPTNFKKEIQNSDRAQTPLDFILKTKK